ncbi:hypothetical protein PVAP13_3NG271325 [Panicum virgatum]|uniref:Uncharacterized protein n=1 Tax=Panicum virgatum TaxID=38727 RepID=A0A8T0UE67_PANVG|nr:hypothetical protein PVAP13_3NG271325 [Panicum virgatum]
MPAAAFPARLVRLSVEQAQRSSKGRAVAWRQQSSAGEFKATTRHGTSGRSSTVRAAWAEWGGAGAGEARASVWLCVQPHRVSRIRARPPGHRRSRSGCVKLFEQAASRCRKCHYPASCAFSSSLQSNNGHVGGDWLVGLNTSQARNSPGQI